MLKETIAPNKCVQSPLLHKPDCSLQIYSHIHLYQDIILGFSKKNLEKLTQMIVISKGIRRHREHEDREVEASRKSAPCWEGSEDQLCGGADELG